MYKFANDLDLAKRISERFNYCGTKLVLACTLLENKGNLIDHSKTSRLHLERKNYFFFKYGVTYISYKSDVSPTRKETVLSTDKCVVEHIAAF